jgi:2-methylcitrate dehydratase
VGQHAADAQPEARVAKLPVAATLARYVASVPADGLAPRVAHGCKLRLLDALGLGLAALDAGPVRAVRAIASRVVDPAGSTLLGFRDRTTPELAALANAAATRYLDGTDVYPGGGTPGDLVAPLAAVAQSARADGAAYLTALALGYEVYHRLYQATALRERGFDHPYYTGVGVAAAAARLLGLDEGRIAHAISIALTAGLPLGVTRRGALAMWKGLAGPQAAHQGVLAALLAARGVTGPADAVDGEAGLREVLGAFDRRPIDDPAPPARVLRSNLKFLLAEYHAQAAIQLALDLARGALPASIAAIEIDTYAFALVEIGSGPEKWAPENRETADHSLPYMVAAALVDGGYSDAIFAPERLRDPRIRALASRIAVREDRGFTARYPAELPTRVRMRWAGGEERAGEVAVPRGHWTQPLGDDEVLAKFTALASRALPADRARSLAEAALCVDRARDLDALFALACVER